MVDEKLCPKCGLVKPYSEYHMHRSGRKAGKPQTYCKSCDAKRSHDDHLKNRDMENQAQRDKYYANRESEKARRRQYYNTHIAEEQRKGRERWYAKGGKPASENLECSKYIGNFAEKVLSTFFKTMQRMPQDNPGFDFLCGKGYKIDVKAACLTFPTDSKSRWTVNIHKNVIADYFLVLLFVDRIEKIPVHVYLIPGSDVNHLTGFSIYNTERNLSKFSKYEKPLDAVLSCGTKLKNLEEDMVESISL